VSIRSEIRDQAIVELNASPPVDVPNCGKRRYSPGEKTNAPRMAAFFGEEDSKPVASVLTKRDLILVIQAIAVVENPEDADDAVEPMLEHITSVMGETNLNGLAHGITEISTLWATGEAQVFIIVALTRWRIGYQTKRNDLTAKQ
jgi:hypothetical protein